MTVRRSGGIGTVSRVLRSRKQAKDSYDKLSRFYDLFSAPFERKYQYSMSLLFASSPVRPVVPSFLSEAKLC
jgi:hypothetical protein